MFVFGLCDLRFSELLKTVRMPSDLVLVRDKELDPESKAI